MIVTTGSVVVPLSSVAVDVKVVLTTDSSVMTIVVGASVEVVVVVM